MFTLSADNVPCTSPDPYSILTGVRELGAALNVVDDAELNNGVFAEQVVHPVDVTQRSAEPVSRMTLKDCGLSREHLDLDMESRLHRTAYGVPMVKLV
jgi:hypothetical protein